MQNPNVALLTTVMANSSSLEVMSGFDYLIKQEEDNHDDNSEKERVKRERKERAERERIEREERERIEREEKERIEQLERREYIERARLEIELLEQHRERLERDRIDKEKQEREKSEHQHQAEVVKEPTENKFKEIENLNKLDRRDPKPTYSKESLQTRRSKENKIHEETPIPPSRISSKLDSKTSNIASRIKQRREIIEIIEKGKQLK